MAELDRGKPVSLEELMVSILAMTDALAKLLIEKGIITDAEFKAEAAGGACGLSAHSESDDAVNWRNGYGRANTRQWQHTAKHYY
jgi:hypothetical protein